MTAKGKQVPRGAFAITPDDVSDLPDSVREIYVGGGGDLTVRGLDGETVTYQDVPAGTFVQLWVVRVFDTGTTATKLVGAK